MLNSLFRIYFMRNSCTIAQIKYNGYNRNIHTSSSLQVVCGDGCDGSESGMEMNPACKVALVTGGTRGVGFAIASQILKAGARKVVVTGIKACNGKNAVLKLNSAYGKNKSMFIGASSTCMVQLEEAFKTTKETFKGLDIVVNTAGVIDGKHWEREVVTDLVGTIRGTLLGFQYMGKESGNKGGVIINVACVTGVKPLPPAPTYCAVQHGIVGLSRSFGDPLHKDKSGVRVVTLLTGLTHTDFLKGLGKAGMTPFLSNELVKYAEKCKKQNPDVCGQAAIHLIQCGKNGSVWLIHGSRLFELKIPYWETYKTLVAQYI